MDACNHPVFRNCKRHEYHAKKVEALYTEAKAELDKRRTLFDEVVIPLHTTEASDVGIHVCQILQRGRSAFAATGFDASAAPGGFGATACAVGASANANSASAFPSVLEELDAQQTGSVDTMDMAGVVAASFSRANTTPTPGPANTGESDGYSSHFSTVNLSSAYIESVVLVVARWFTLEASARILNSPAMFVTLARELNNYPYLYSFLRRTSQAAQLFKYLARFTLRIRNFVCPLVIKVSSGSESILVSPRLVDDRALGLHSHCARSAGHGGGLWSLFPNPQLTVSISVCGLSDSTYLTLSVVIYVCS